MKLMQQLTCSFVVIAFLNSTTLADDRVDFNLQIRSLLSNNCIMCHGPDEEARSTELRLDTQDGSQTDLGGYAAIVPGKPDASELIERLTTDDEDLRMPPAGKGRRLTKQEIQTMRRWIEQGGEYAKHWSYEKPIRHKLPTVRQTQWPRNAIDHFVLARLEAAGLAPSSEADRVSIARRLSIDLTGLPPTWEEVQNFVNDDRPNAYEHYVDTLLEKPAFGERWARVWLDLARYADSAGYADDPPRTIWAYRDYVIRSLNANKPFDQFTIEQIAGDLLDNPTDEQLVATAFHRNTLTNNEGGTNDEEFRNVAVVDRVNTTMAVWMGTTMACAQCHTHKYDPITHEEYFQFFAFFNNSEDADRRNESPLLELWSEEQKSLKSQWSDQIAELKDRLQQQTPELDAALQLWLTNVTRQPIWKSLKPISASAKKRTLHVGDDHWIVADGEKPDKDLYSLQLETEEQTVTGIRLETSAQQAENFVLSQVTGHWTPTEPRSIDARYVRVELPGKGKMIHLAELQVFSGGENIGPAGKPKQSSTGFGGSVQRVNDGNTDGNYKNNSVTHTEVQDNPWIEIDLGATRPIDQVVIWNRTDGGASVSERLKGYKVLLLDDKRKTIWEDTPKDVPNPSQEINASGTIQLNFTAAYADFEQSGFPASSVIAAKLDPKKGWAIAGQTDKPHQLTLMLSQPVSLAKGVLNLRLNHASPHAKHLLNQVKVSTTESENASEWARMPAKIRKLIRSDGNRSDQDSEALATFYRSIAPSLAPARKQLAKLEKQLKEIKPYTTVPVMRDLAPAKHRKTNIQIRGNYLAKGAEVSQATPAAFHSLPPNQTADRMGLAHWLIDPENPLTARVIANRHWEQIFGTGIVESSEEFGSQGELPSHPQLLDWLAIELQANQWNLKALIKLMVTSATYRQSSATTSEQQESDPFNRLLARGPRFRISAEMVRDQALFVSGLLSDKMFGAPVKPPQPNLGLKAAFGSATDWKTSDGDDKYRRGIYTNWRRSSPYPSMATFDAPNREVCTIRRTRTNTPLQALVTLNDPVYVEAAQALARRMLAASQDTRERLRFGINTCLLREPTEGELDRLSGLFERAYESFKDQPENAESMATDPLGPLPNEIDITEAAAMTLVGNVLLNLDEMMMPR